jgi:hypothetical protein
MDTITNADHRRRPSPLWALGMNLFRQTLIGFKTLLSNKKTATGAPRRRRFARVQTAYKAMAWSRA